MIGKLLNDRYKIKEKRGSGGMALVYKAQDILLDRVVAIKMLRPEFVSDEDFVNKFRHEAKAVARITHPNVVSIYDIVESEDSLYLVMEYIEGNDLKSIIRKRGKLTVAEALDIANQVTAGVEIAHKNNIIHCDIKPHNILITSKNQVKVTDFGIARAITSSTMTITDTVIGSAHYFSPEQAQGQEISTYSDIYSIGIVLYEMLTGQVPFKGDSPISVALKHIQSEPRNLKDINPKIPDRVNNLVMKALSKEPKDRFSNTSILRKELIQALKNIKIKDSKIDTLEIESKNNKTRVIDKNELREKSKVVNQDKIKKNKTRLSANNQNKNKKYKKVIIWTLVLIIFFSASIFGFFYFLRTYTDVPIVKVPDLIGVSYKEATDIGSQTGLTVVKSEEEVFHNEVKKGHIISQEPIPGERVKQTRQIVVTVSKGPKLVQIPNFEGRPLREAEVILDNLGLILGEVEYEYSEEIDQNYIISQSVEPETETEINTEIYFVVSKGPQPNMISMPNLLGIKKDRAFDIIVNNGLEVGMLNYTKSTRYDEGLIISQQFEAGENVPEKSNIDLTISTGLINSGNYTEHQTNIAINIVGSNQQEIKIVVNDSNGEEVIYQEVHNPGQFINKKIYSVGPTTINIYRDDQLIKTKKIGN
ncbi:MAG: Stk1 family PASTA domain-containing Ser/Thr kinase [Halanaerobiales bacterium]|nr:Stk1 family PASTA domain-containing Ser/Thr kinase [Halanaerobiales bacterium]